MVSCGEDAVPEVLRAAEGLFVGRDDGVACRKEGRVGVGDGLRGGVVYDDRAGAGALV